MSTLTYPGVYVKEVPSGVRPIQAASTSVAAFIGVTEKGPIKEAVKIYNFTEYQNIFGGFLNGSFLTHAVYQFFNNGGNQCYIIRVTGGNEATADIVLNDRAAGMGGTSQESLRISAASPGVWGNNLSIIISEEGATDRHNEFNIEVYEGHSVEGVEEYTLLETFKNLSMIETSPRYVQTITSSSIYIRVTPNKDNTNSVNFPGSSQGSAPPAVPLAGTTSKFRINLNGDGYQEVDLTDGVGTDTGMATDLNTPANIAIAIQYVVRQLDRLRESTDQNAFGQFTCEVETIEGQDVLVLQSGAGGPKSSVYILPASDEDSDCANLLNIGKLKGGIEKLGAAVMRPCLNPSGSPYYHVGDNSTSISEVVLVTLGSDGDPVTTDAPFIDAFEALDDKEDVSLISVPGIGSPAVLGYGMNYCANPLNRPLSDCFFIGDMAPDDNTVNLAIEFNNLITPKNSYGAVYLPWLRIVDPTGASPEPILVPPSGFVAGIYAKTDAQRGIWKAPAGTTAALGGGIVGLATNFTDVQQGNLNPININVIRQFASSGIVLWGARTITSDPEYMYIPVRRIAIFLRVSIYRGIQWAVFEPNDEPLWASLRLNIRSFMMGLFRQGAFQGATPAEAFFVKCDSETTTQGDIDQGIVNILVGFAPLKPAEFVVVRISQKAGQTS